VDADAVSRRILVLADTLRELAKPECSDVDRLATDRTLRAAVERWLQVAVEACIDIAAHIVAAEGWTPPDSGRAAFNTLAAHGRIPPDLARRLGLAVGLRNLLVHDYAEVDPARLAATVRDDLGDLRAFAGHVGEAALGD
jgi:uncharacterized protein YutE (UPF0331/DUF86 family)